MSQTQTQIEQALGRPVKFAEWRLIKDFESQAKKEKVSEKDLIALVLSILTLKNSAKVWH